MSFGKWFYWSSKSPPQMTWNQVRQTANEIESSKERERFLEVVNSIGAEIGEFDEHDDAISNLRTAFIRNDRISDAIAVLKAIHDDHKKKDQVGFTSGAMWNLLARLSLFRLIILSLLILALFGYVALVLPGTMKALSSWLDVTFPNMSRLDVSLSEAAQAGDMFGMANALFSGLALIGAIIAIVIQSKEIRLQREELRLSRLENARSAQSLSEQAETLKSTYDSGNNSMLFELYREYSSITPQKMYWVIRIERLFLSEERSFIEHFVYKNILNFQSPVRSPAYYDSIVSGRQGKEKISMEMTVMHIVGIFLRVAVLTEFSRFDLPNLMGDSWRLHRDFILKIVDIIQQYNVDNNANHGTVYQSVFQDYDDFVLAPSGRANK